MTAPKKLTTGYVHWGENTYRVTGNSHAFIARPIKKVPERMPPSRCTARWLDTYANAPLIATTRADFTPPAAVMDPRSFVTLRLGAGMAFLQVTPAGEGPVPDRHRPEPDAYTCPLLFERGADLRTPRKLDWRYVVHMAQALGEPLRLYAWGRLDPVMFRGPKVGAFGFVAPITI